jgi:hypothetical protein
MVIASCTHQGGPVKACIAAVTLALLAFPATALAVSDARAPDQRTPHDIPSYLPTTGTDVAAADQQASTRHTIPSYLPKNPVDAAVHTERASVGGPGADPAPSGSGFDWSDAGVGAASAACLVALSLAGAMALRRRERRPPSALAG